MMEAAVLRLEAVKKRGGTFFAAGEWAKAKAEYAAVVGSVQPNELAYPTVEAVVLASRANISLCYLKLNEPELALAEIEAAERMPGYNLSSLLPKLLLRKIEALTLLDRDFEAVLEEARRRGLRSRPSLFDKRHGKVEEKPWPPGKPAQRPIGHLLGHLLRGLNTGDFEGAGVEDVVGYLRQMLEDEFFSVSLAYAADKDGGCVAWAVCAGARSYEGDRRSFVEDVFCGFLRLLLEECNVPVDMRFKERETTAMHFATAAAFPKAVAYLLERGASVRLRDSSGWTPLHCSCMTEEAEGGPAVSERLAVVRLLIAAGAELDAQSQDGTTALYYACSAKNLPMVQCLIEAGASDLRDSYGQNGLSILGQVAGDADADACASLLSLSIISPPEH